MIDYNLNKRVYANENEFTYVSGGDYTGYITVLSGQAYTAKTNAAVVPADYYESSLYLSPFLKNRDINEPVILPYDANDILFGANDFLTYGGFTEKLNRLHDNNTFVYSRMFMSDNDLPVKTLSGDNITNYTFAYLADSNSSSFLIGNSIVENISFEYSLNEKYKQLGNIRRFASKLKDEDPNSYTIFAITSSGFTSLTGNRSECSVIEQHSVYIESTRNALTFGQLFDITLAKNFIFITDEQNSVIYKYDIAGYYNGDIALANKRNLIEILGGDGPKEAKNLFKKPKHIASTDDVIIVNDSGNKVLKIFDLDFNYITRIGSLPLQKESVLALKTNYFYNTLYVLTQNNTTGKVNLYLIDLECYRLVEKYSNIPLNLQVGESVCNIDFSKNSSDYYYICTDKRVFKLFVSKPTVIIGTYQNTNLDLIAGPSITNPQPGEVTPLNQWSVVKVNYSKLNQKWGNCGDEDVSIQDTCNITQTLRGSLRFIGISFMETTENYDSVIFLTNERVYFFNETNQFKSVIKSTNLTRYGRVGASLSTEEYIQASTINKELYKVARDILVLKNSIVGRFTGVYDSSNTLTLKDYNYNIDFDTFSLIQTEDYYIHENEKALVTVINRSLSNILDLQKKLIDLTVIDKGNTVKKELTLTPNFSCKIIS